MSKNSQMINTPRGERIAKKVFREALCNNHRPFVKMEKIPERHAWRCPQCGNEMDEIVRRMRHEKSKGSC